MRFFIVTDFVTVSAYDRRVDDFCEFPFAELKNNYDFFLPLTGLYEKPLEYSAHPADQKACEKMGKLYDIIKTNNHYDDSNLHDLNTFLTRLLFCFYAEDTGIFPKKGQMTEAIEANTKADGSDLKPFFEQLFTVLDLSMDDPKRKEYSATLQAFPYVNGSLFSEKCNVPEFAQRGRSLMIECGRLTWSDISPVIFGSMFQSVMNPDERRELGAHYTSEKNIFKLIRPLFLDDLEAELDKLLELKDKSDKISRLKAFQVELGSLKFLDPACGSGNFLIVSYRELKNLELKALKARLDLEAEQSLSLFMDEWKGQSHVQINQFYGIEIGEFAADIARVSMWLMEHVMNQKFGELLGQTHPLIPLKSAARIVCANSLTTDWQSIVSAGDLNYILGNPPFGGSSIISKAQKAEVVEVFDRISGAGVLDYVAAWYGKASKLMLVNKQIHAAFVSTNSICQGEQVAPLWGTLFARGVKILFAHQTFKWTNEARGKAGVYCVIVGFSCDVEDQNRRLFTYSTPNSDPVETRVNNINAYLIDRSNTIVKSEAKTLSSPNAMVRGNQPTDGGNLIVEPEEYDVLAADEKVAPFIKKLIGSKELLHNLPRYCLWLVNAPQEVLEIPVVAERIERCRQMRLGSIDKGCHRLAERASQFRDLNNPSSAIVIPAVSSERREYIPMGFVGQDTIVTNLCHIVQNGTLFDFGILESRMHMTWMRTVCGRLESRYRYSRDLCYNTFPWPEVTEGQKKTITNLARNVLMTREYYPEMTLADLYDPDKMPEGLKKAHHELDLAVERLYRKKPFDNDAQRLHHLFSRYEKLVKHEDSSDLFNEE